MKINTCDFACPDQVCCKAAGTSAVSSFVMRKRRKMLSPPCSSPNFFRMGCKLCFNRLLIGKNLRGSLSVGFWRMPERGSPKFDKLGRKHD